RRIESPDDAGLLGGEPEDAARVEDGRVRIDPALGHRMALERVALRVEPPDVLAGDGGEPDVAVAIGGEAVRAGAFGQREFVDVAGAWIETAQLVGLLLGEPERSVGSAGGIVRLRARRGNVEF